MTMLFLPIVQGNFKVVSVRSLKGVYNAPKKPELTFHSVTTGKYQSDIEKYISKHHGFREPIIRIYNQYIWSCYHKTYNSWIDIGKDDWLYECDFVRDHYESLMYKYAKDTTEIKQRFDKTAEKLYKLQEILKDHGTYLFVNMAPGKDIIYPEYLPENTKYFRPEGIRAYDYYKKRFDELGVNYIDIVELFKKMKDSVDYQLFPKTGTHWSNIGATHAFDTIIRYMESLNGMNLLNVEIGAKYADKVREPDDDLEQIFNLIFPIKPNKNYYADTKIIPDPDAVKPNFITIGDSFFWTISYNYKLKELFNKYPYWYYNSTIYFDPDNKSTKDVNILSEILNADYIMLIYCTAQIYKLGNGFIESALTLLYDEETQTPLSQDVINMIKYIYSDKKWLDNIKIKAEKNKVSLEKQIVLDAKWTINHKQ